MAKYTVTHSCGHDHTHQLFGPHKDRDRKIEWLKTTPCGACFAAQRDQERAAASAAAAESNQGLPELVGTPKQIAWAETIRAAAVVVARDLRERLSKVPSDRTAPEEAQTKARAKLPRAIESAASGGPEDTLHLLDCAITLLAGGPGAQEIRDTAELALGEIEREADSRKWIDGRHRLSMTDMMAAIVRRLPACSPSFAALVASAEVGHG